MTKRWVAISFLFLLVAIGIGIYKYAPNKDSGAPSSSSYTIDDVPKTSPAPPVIEDYCQTHLDRCRNACDPAQADAHEDTPHAKTPEEIEVCRIYCQLQLNDCRAKATEADATQFERYDR